MSKPFLTYEEQIELLKSKGIKIIKNKSTVEILQRENYYRVINGYKDLFIDKNSSEEQFIEGTKFSEIYALYNFDRSLRNLFLEKILKIENSIKSVIAYEFSKNYGHKDYLLKSNFDEKNRKEEDIEGVIEFINDAVNKQKQHEAISHYLKKHNFIPMWVLVNILTLGTVSNFYSIMKQNDRIAISKIFNILEVELEKYLKLLTYYRNKAAHEERMYKTKTKHIIRNNKIHLKMNIEKDYSGNYKYGRGDIFALLIVCKMLLKKDEVTSLVRGIDKIVKELDKKLITVPTDKVLELMGFPKNWKEINL